MANCIAGKTYFLSTDDSEHSLQLTNCIINNGGSDNYNGILKSM